MLKSITSGQRHLRAVIGSIDYKNKFVKEKIAKLTLELQLLSKIAEIELQAAYSAYVSGFRSKLDYLLRTVPEISGHLYPLENVLRRDFIPAITSGRHCSDLERSLLSLPTRYGGLNIGIPCDEAIHEYGNSRFISSDLPTAIIEQNDDHIQNQDILKENKNKIITSREKRHKEKSCLIGEQLNENLRRLHDIAQEKGVSNWLTVLPIDTSRISLKFHVYFQWKRNSDSNYSS